MLVLKPHERGLSVDNVSDCLCLAQAMREELQSALQLAAIVLG